MLFIGSLIFFNKNSDCLLLFFILFSNLYILLIAKS